MMKRLFMVFMGILLGGCTGLAAHIPLFSLLLLPPLPALASLASTTAVTSASPTLPALPSSTPSPAGKPTPILPTATSTPFPTASPYPSPSPTLNLYIQGPFYFPEEINPLTGLPADRPELLDRRPIAVKVTNFPRSVRPQWGLSLADHVYEYYIGDDMSRFIGIFYGRDASRVGPIRSARLFDERIMRLYAANFAFGWADDPILDRLLVPELLPRLIVEHGENCPPLCRIGPKYAYNNLYIDTSQVAAYQQARDVENERQALDGLRFETHPPKSGNPGERIAIFYSSVSYHKWEYDQDSGRYLRYQESQSRRGDETSYAPLTDALTNLQLSADNIIILRVPHEYFYQSSSTEIIDQPIQGEGNGYALRDRQLYPIHWSRSDSQAMLKFTLPNQRPYPLKPGNVWLEILGESSTFSQTLDNSWLFEFSIP